MVRILFMTSNAFDRVFSNFYYFQQEVGKYADCKWAGPGWPNHVKNESLSRTIKRLHKNDSPDWVIDNYPRFDIPKDRCYKVGICLEDLHGAFSLRVSPEGFVKILNKARYDAVFARYLYSPYKYVMLPILHVVRKFDRNYYIKNLRADIFHLPWSINPSIFRPIEGEKKWDVTFIGRVSRVYPLRRTIYKSLPSLGRKKNWRIFCLKTPPIGSFPKMSRIRSDPNLKSKYYVGIDYATILARSKIFIFGSSVFKYPVSKFFEGMACGVLVMADKPQTAEKLHFKPGVKFVEINKDDWKEKLSYYLENDDEREEIAQRGYETVMKYHTNEVRAKEFISYLGGHYHR